MGKDEKERSREGIPGPSHGQDSEFPLQGALVGELRSHKPHGMARKNIKQREAGK